MAYQAKYWNGSAWVAVANASFDTSGLVKTTGNTGTVDLSGAPVVKGAGMDLIVPTSVTGGTYSASGAITFSAVSTLSINGCFTSAYDNYKIMVRVTPTADVLMKMRLRVSGVDNSTASSYLIERINAYTTGVTASQTQTTEWSGISVYTNAPNVSSFELFSPAASVWTHLVGSSYYAAGAYQSYAGEHSQNTAYDGISIYPASGTITGTLRIYGYHN